MLSLIALLLPFSFACPPQPNGNCYAGIFSGGTPSFNNQRCNNDPLRDWCAVTYQPASGVANFGCANSLRMPLLSPSCGQGIEQQGCHQMDSPQGPCLLCCCKGGSCNHPSVEIGENSVENCL